MTFACRYTELYVSGNVLMLIVHKINEGSYVWLQC